MTCLKMACNMMAMNLSSGMGTITSAKNYVNCVNDLSVMN